MENSGFAPVKCSNEECEMIVNKREIVHHESTVCEYRKVKCHNCGKIEQDVEEMKEKIHGVNKKMEGMTADVDEVKRLMVQIFKKLRFLENTIQISSAVNYASNAYMEDIYLAGGWDNRGRELKSVERFSWKKNAWKRCCSLNVGRVGATSFVYENQVFVAGGCDSPIVEVFNLSQYSLQRSISEAVLPFVCKCLLSVVYQNRAIFFCACGNVDHVTELSLTAPYTCKQLCEMPDTELPRKHYAVVTFEHEVLIFGGSSPDSCEVHSVLEFNLTTKEFKVRPSMPFAIPRMAGVRWGDQAVLIGGFDGIGPSKKVLMYDSKTGKTTELPPMLEERSGAVAVITGNTIVVMGGKGESGRVRSVEAFTLGGYSWRYLPAMNDIRSLPTATVLPGIN